MWSRNLAETNLTDEQDTAGQERFSSLSSAFFRGADAVLLLFDVTSPDTLVALKKWWEEFKEKAPLDDEDMEDYCCVVVGNKIDLRAESEGCVAESEALAFLDELVPPSSPRSTPIEIQPQRTSSIPMPSSTSPIPVLQNVSPTMPPASVSFVQPPSRGRSPSSRFYGTATSTRTTLSIYHTPSSSFFDTFHSARTSPEPVSSSPVLSTRSRRTTKLSTGSGSSGITITPSVYHGRESTTTTETAITIPDSPIPRFQRSALPIAPERGPKLFFASAKTGEGVADPFEYIAERVIRKWAYDEQMEARLLHYREASGDETIRLGLRNTSGKQNGMLLGSRRVANCCS